MNIGKLVVFEGIDNVGKPTIVSILNERLDNADQTVSVLSFPGKEDKTLGQWVYEFHHSGIAESTDKTSLQLLHIAAHIDCITKQLTPRLAAGEIVILDRFWWSTLVYGLVDEVSVDHLNAMINLEAQVWGSQNPDCLFLIRREETENQPGSNRLTQEYKKLALRERNKYPIVEVFNDGELEATIDTIIQTLSELEIAI